MADSQAPRFAGQPMDLGGTTYVVPPLSLGQLKRLMPTIAALRVSTEGAVGIEQTEDLLVVIHAALSRNYPELTLEQLLDLVDLGNFKALTLAVMGQSGLQHAPEGNSGPGTGSP